MERLGGRTIRFLVAFAATSAVVAALHFGRPLLVPFVLATLVTLLLAPAVNRLQKWGLGRVPAVVLVVGLSFIVLAGAGWVLTGQLARLGSDFQKHKNAVLTKVRSLRGPMGEVFGKGRAATQEIQEELSSTLGKGPAASSEAVRVQVVEAPSPALKPFTDAAGSFLEILGEGAVVLLLGCFLLVYYADVRDRILRLVGDRQIHLTTHAMNEAGTSISRYLAMHSILNGIHGTLLGLGLFALGVPNALLWGILAATLRFIPYLGPWVSAVLPIAMALVVFEGWALPLGVMGFLAGLELVSNMVLEPWLYGRRTGLSPLAVVVSAIFWASVWGGIGLVLAVPMSVCLLVLGRHVPGLGFLAILLGSEPPLEPHVRLYHRLLAKDPDEALDAALDWRKTKPEEDIYDGLLLPTLALAEADRQAGKLEEAGEADFYRGLKELVEELEGPVAPQGAAPQADIRVLCLPAEDESDGVAAEILARALSRSGIPAETAPAEAMVGEKVESVEQRRADIVVISALPPWTVASARYLYKRLRRRFPDMEIVVGLWTAKNDLGRVQARYAPDGKTYLVGTLADARKRVHELSEALRLSKDAPSAPHVPVPV